MNELWKRLKWPKIEVIGTRLSPTIGPFAAGEVETRPLGNTPRRRCTEEMPSTENVQPVLFGGSECE